MIMSISKLFLTEGIANDMMNYVAVSANDYYDHGIADGMMNKPRPFG